MARGDDCKTAAVKTLDFGTPSKKSVPSGAYAKTQQPLKKAEEKKSYGAWGPIYKNKENFVNMHFC